MIILYINIFIIYNSSPRGFNHWKGEKGENVLPCGNSLSHAGTIRAMPLAGMAAINAMVEERTEQ